MALKQKTPSVMEHLQENSSKEFLSNMQHARENKRYIFITIFYLLDFLVPEWRGQLVYTAEAAHVFLYSIPWIQLAGLKNFF